MAQPDPISEFIALPQDRQMQLLKKLPRENQDKLLAQVSARRSPEKKKALPAPTYGGEIAAAGERVVSGIGGSIKNLLTPHETAGATREQEVKIGPAGRLLYNIPADIEEGWMNAEAARQASAKSGENWAGQTLAYGENLPLVGGLVRKAEEAGPGYAKFSPQTAGAVTEGATYAALPKAIEKAAPLVKKAIPKLPAPRAIKDLVKKTQAENVTGTAKAAEEQAKHIEATKGVEEHNRAEMAKHDTAIQDAARENLKAHLKHVGAEAEAETRTALESNIKAKSDLLDVKTEKARHDALVEGNKKYSAVNESLNPVPANDEAIAAAKDEAFDSIKGTHVKPPILESITARLKEGGLTYEDLQGYYSELNRELAKGTLPGDIYHAYDVMQEAVGEDMQRIADLGGMGAELTAARAFWRRMKQTFGKSSDTAGDRAGKFVGEEAPGTIEEQSRQYRQRLLGSFDPTIPGLSDEVAKARADLKALPKAGEVPQYPEAVEVQPPNIKKAPAPPAPFKPAKIGATEIEAAKAENLEKTARWVGTKGLAFAVWPAVAIIREIARGQMPNLGMAGAEAGATIMAARTIERVLESPAVVKLLTKATERDVAAIPADLRGDFPGIVKAAQAKGIKVSPAIIAMFASKGPAPLTPGQQTNAYANQGPHP